MSQGKREESRMLLLSQRQLIGSLFSEHEETEASLRRFIQHGGATTAERDYDRNRAAVEAKIQEIRRNGGKVIFPCQDAVT
jgi:hypothetical protein